jgi:hypothetical protein
MVRDGPSRPSTYETRPESTAPPSLTGVLSSTLSSLATTADV